MTTVNEALSYLRDLTYEESKTPDINFLHRVYLLYGRDEVIEKLLLPMVERYFSTRCIPKHLRNVESYMEKRTRAVLHGDLTKYNKDEQVLYQDITWKDRTVSLRSHGLRDFMLSTIHTLKMDNVVLEAGTIDRVTFTDAAWKDVTLRAMLTSGTFEWSFVEGATFEKHISMTLFKSVGLENCVFKGNLQHVNFTRCNLKGVRFEGCTLSEVMFFYTDFTDVEFVNCTFIKCSIVQSEIHSMKFTKCIVDDECFQMTKDVHVDEEVYKEWPFILQRQFHDE